jgi:hypothetical protein
LIATGVVDTGGKFVASVVDTGGNLPPASLTPVANLPLGILDTGGKFAASVTTMTCEYLREFSKKILNDPGVISGA